MNTPLTNDERTEALFVSDLQRSQRPTTKLIQTAITATVDRFGPNGCAALVAQEFGEHPECAQRRMQWARLAVRNAFRNANHALREIEGLNSGP